MTNTAKQLPQDDLPQPRNKYVTFRILEVLAKERDGVTMAYILDTMDLAILKKQCAKTALSGC